MKTPHLKNTTKVTDVKRRRQHYEFVDKLTLNIKLTKWETFTVNLHHVSLASCGFYFLTCSGIFHIKRPKCFTITMSYFTKSNWAISCVTWLKTTGVSNQLTWMTERKDVINFSPMKATDLTYN